MSFQVFLTDDASTDLEELYDYIEMHDVPGKVESVLSEIEKVFSSISDNPERGVYPKELLSLGIREYRELFFKPYRIIYRILNNMVYVMLIVDGRRYMQSLLQRRLFMA